MGTLARPSLIVELGKDTVPDEDVLSLSIDRDINHVDHATVTLARPDRYARVPINTPVRVYTGDHRMLLYEGVVISIAPVYDGKGNARVMLGALNYLSRMAQKKRSQTFVDRSDRDIVAQVAKDSGLDLRWAHDTTLTHAHVYQVGQSDLELVRGRAARLGCHVWCAGAQLFVQQPTFKDELPIALSVDEESTNAQLRSFRPRMSVATVVGKVTVRGWNPETKELLVGEATAQRSRLGAVTAVAAAGAAGSEDTVTVDQPIWSREEATAMARARLQEALLGFITGEAELTGNPSVELGKVVSITANARDDRDPFNGKYYITGITHRGGGGAFTTTLRLARDAQGKPS